MKSSQLRAGGLFLPGVLAAFLATFSIVPAARADDFKGLIGTTDRNSKPDFAPPVGAKPGSPNVLYILLDDVGFADFGSFGSEIQTPNIDRVAAQGLRYNNFHTRAICSPTRAALLTGRNSHSVGMRTIANLATGYPSGRGEITHEAATVAEILRGGGYSTYAAGKWHLVPPRNTTSSGPFDQWPTQRGFDRYYGFLDAMTDQFHPELVKDNTRIEPPNRPGYHLTEDLVDHTIDFLRSQTAASPVKPFFAYLAFGAAHSPHQVSPEYIDKYIPVFEKGWDRTREERFARQKASSIIPPGAELPPRNPGVKPWDSLSREEMQLFVRLQAAYAGFLDHADVQIGRVLDFLKSVERLDNTIIVVTSDNGASQEGGLEGTLNEIGSLSHVPESLEANRRRIDDIGTERSFTNYPLGWASAGNTPFRLYKNHPFGGGNNDPLIISWPKGIADRGGIRSQFVDVIDITPTVLGLAGVEIPKVFQGLLQKPLEGVSIAGTFAKPDAPAPRTTQYFELHGNRAVWHEGWKAVAVHRRGEEFDDDRWLLFNLGEDFSESRDLAEHYPQKLAELKEVWWREARKYGVLPLLDIDALDPRTYPRAVVEALSGPTMRTFFPGQEHLPAIAAPSIKNRSFSITAFLNPIGTAVEGVIVAQGELSGGYSFYMKDRKLVFDFNDLGIHSVLTSGSEVPSSKSTLRYHFQLTADHQGTGTLFINDNKVGEHSMTLSPARLLSWEGLDVGLDGLSPVSPAYSERRPFPFTPGVLEKVVINVERASLDAPSTPPRDAR
jgi:arylsulfatase A-like enzyme